MITKCVSIDIVTTGPDPDKHQILELAAVVDVEGLAVYVCPVFHCYVVHDVIHGEVRTLSTQSETLRRIAAREGGHQYLAPWKLAADFGYFLKRNGADNFAPPAGTCLDPSYSWLGEIVVIGLDIDTRFLRKLPAWHTYNQARLVTREIAAKHWDPKAGRLVPDIEACMARAGIHFDSTAPPIAKAHGAILLARYNDDAERELLAGYKRDLAATDAKLSAAQNISNNHIIWSDLNEHEIRQH